MPALGCIWDILPYKQYRFCICETQVCPSLATALLAKWLSSALSQPWTAYHGLRFHWLSVISTGLYFGLTVGYWTPTMHIHIPHTYKYSLLSVEGYIYSTAPASLASGTLLQMWRKDYKTQNTRMSAMKQFLLEMAASTRPEEYIIKVLTWKGENFMRSHP